jgi:glycerol-3-phosphate acyltransferase PlsY
VTAAAGALIGYLFGSLPVGLMVGRRYGIDVRDFGSGKAGFTNALRSLGLAPALLVMAGDVAKGIVPVLIGRALFDDPWAAALAGAAAIAGHTRPLFAGFRGGRGVATAFGAFLAMSPLAALLLLAVAGAVLAVTRYVSLMSVTGVFAGFLVLVALVVAGLLPAEYLAFGVIATAFVEISHLGNIRRLLSGTEPKIGEGGAPRGQGGG